MNNSILSAIASGCQSLTHDNIKPMPGDKWLLASALQKTIRRGQKDYALQAAKALWLVDKRSFWRRLHIISLEDVGCGSPDAVIATLTAYSSSYWRRQLGDLQVGLYLTGLLCDAVKTRFADQLCVQLGASQECRQQGNDMRDWPGDKLADCVLNPDDDIKTRSLALWLIAGTKAYPAEHFTQTAGSVHRAAEMLNQLDVDQVFTQACINVLKATEYPLALFSPLILQTIALDGPSVQQNDLGELQVEGGVPLCAADTFTRLGRTCFKSLQSKVPDFKQFTVKQIGIGQFYLEGGLIDEALTSPYLDQFKLDGELADAEAVRLCPSRYLGLRDCLQENAAMLADIRRTEIRKHLRDWREQSLFEKRT